MAHLLQRRNDLVLEPLHADAEGARDVLHSAGQRRIDVLRQSRDGLRQFARPLLQRLADLRRLGVHALNDLATAFAERARDFERVARKRLRKRAAALGEAFLDAGEQSLERAGHLVELGFGALVDRLQVGIEQRRRLLVVAGEPFVDRAAPTGQRLLDCAELGGKIADQRFRAVADLAHEVAAASVDRRLETRQAVAERSLDAAGLRQERLIDRVVVRGRSGLELPQTLSRLRRQLFEMVAEALVEILATGSQDGVQRAEMVGQSGVEFVRVNGDAIDRAVAVFADQIVERLQLPAHSPRLIGEGLDQSDAALADDGLEGGDLRGQGVMDVGCACRNRGRGVAGEGREAAADLRRFGVELDEQLRRRLLDLRLRGRSVDRDRPDDAMRGVVNEGFDSGVLVLDRSAQLRLAGVELLAPALGGRVESGRRVRRAIAQKRRDALARAFESCAKGLAAFDDGLLQAIGRAVEADDEIRAVDEHGVGQSGAGGVQPLEQRLGTIVEVAGERIAGFAEPAGDQVALGADGFDRLRSVGIDAADDFLGVLVQGRAHHERRLGQTRRDGVPLRVDRLGRLREARSEGVSMQAERLDGLCAARVDAPDEGLGVRADGAARRVDGLRETRCDGVAMGANGLESVLAARVDSTDDLVGLHAESAGQCER